eukprot:symbB.v1.2.011468.t1/scaffold770.1/size163962/4
MRHRVGSADFGQAWQLCHLFSEGAECETSAGQAQWRRHEGMSSLGNSESVGIESREYKGWTADCSELVLQRTGEACAEGF